MKSIGKHVVAQTAVKGFKSLLEFVDKINNDWVLSFASGVAFNLLVAIIPIITAILSLAGFIYGGLNPQIQHELIGYIQNAFPQPIPSEDIVGLALDSLNESAGALGLLAAGVAVFAGSGLFVSLEGYFDIIYRSPTRGPIRQYVMAIGMILLFVVLTPLMVLDEAFPTLVHSFLQSTPLGSLASNGFLFNLLDVFCGLSISWVLIELMYLVVPNQRMSFRESWLGALLAAVAIQLYLSLFPFYVTHFLSGYVGAVGLTVILMFFFYYFAVILLIGAEFNAFFAQGKRALPGNLAGMVHDQSVRGPGTLN